MKVDAHPTAIMVATFVRGSREREPRCHGRGMARAGRAGARCVKPYAVAVAIKPRAACAVLACRMAVEGSGYGQKY
eukprot:6653724-Prymnesium_polylepis.1